MTFLHRDGATSPDGLPWLRAAVYYPYIHFRDERWLKIAALYLPSMVRIVGKDYPTRNSGLVDVLARELGFIIDDPPDDAARRVAAPFARVIEGLEPEALLRLRVEQEPGVLAAEDLVLPHSPAVLGGPARRSLLGWLRVGQRLSPAGGCPISL
jgi:hypothetical protein